MMAEATGGRSSSGRSDGGPRARIVHLFPMDVTRGAQLFGRVLRLRLDGDPDEHRTVSLFASEPGALRPDVSLGVVPGRWRRLLGLEPRAILVLRRWLRSHGPDIVVAHGGEALKYAALACPHRTALVYKKTGTSAGNIRYGLQRHVYRLLARRADLTAAVGEEACREAGELLRLPADRVVRTPNGRDPSEFAPAETEQDDQCEPRLIFVGHLVASKRPELFLDLVRRLRASGRGVQATMVGDGPARSALQAVADQLDVVMLGRRDDVPALLRAADILAFSGSSEGEGMPGVLIEAGLSALPVVTTAVSGASTVVEDGITGFVVPIGDLESLFAAVVRLVDDRHLRLRMGAAARQRCLDNFTLEASMARWQALFARLLGRTPPSPGGATVTSEGASV